MLGKKWHLQPGLQVLILRSELATLGACGNKQYKLANNITQLKERGCKAVLSFGGAWSNHLHALSVQTRLQGMEFVGIVRGDAGVSNELLTAARRNGMRQVNISRADYRLRHDPDYCLRLCSDYHCDHWLPEGGSNAAAVDGCKKILRLTGSVAQPPDVIVVAVGTGATLAGIVCSADKTQSVIGLPVVRDPSVDEKIARWIEQDAIRQGTDVAAFANWRLADPLKPGYGKADPALIEFILKIYDDTGIVLDPVYTGKALKRILAADFTDELPPDTRMAFVHTGGLMGNFGFRKQFLQAGSTELVERYFASVNGLLESGITCPETKAAANRSGE